METEHKETEGVKNAPTTTSTEPLKKKRKRDKRKGGNPIEDCVVADSNPTDTIVEEEVDVLPEEVAEGPLNDYRQANKKIRFID